MPTGTKLALANTLKGLLQKKSLDDITVKEIVEGCDVNRQTFYYHFQDIFDLLCWLLEHETALAISAASNWQEMLLSACRYIQENHLIVNHIARSNGRVYLEELFYQLTRNMMSDLLDAQAGDLALAEYDRDFLLDFYMYALTGMVSGWFYRDMREDPEALVARIAQLVNGGLRESAQAFCATPPSPSNLETKCPAKGV